MGELLNVLQGYAASDHLPMHMPGHKRRMGNFPNPYEIDLTEIEGFDNLHHAEGILLRAQERAAKLYHSEETHFLINGSTAGILAAITGCTTHGGTLLMARNSHKSVYHGALLGGLQTVCLYPQSTGNLGINGVILPEDVEDALRSDPKIQAVVITSPTYDGVVSDVEAIADIVHGYGKSLIVDEAHGAHFPFSKGFPKDSISCGADVVIHSLHKTLPALTQTALIHLNGPLINREKIRKYLTIYQTSSPSYVLMAGIDECIEWVSAHPEAFSDFIKELQRFRAELQRLKHLKLLEVPGMDLSKILISVRETIIHGKELARILREDYRIETEMACGTYVCAITTIADTRESLARFKEALFSIDKKLTDKDDSENVTDEVIRAEAVCTLLQAEEAKQEQISLLEACGRVSGDFITLYPPGIPIAAPGERLTEAVVQRIRWYMEHGLEVDGVREGQITAVKSGKIFCLMGKTSSGKDTIYKRLMEDQDLHLKRIVPYTTRPIRQGEQEGIEYHFVTEEKMCALEQTGKIVERRAYHTVHGIWYYFTVCEEQMNLAEDDYITIGTLESWQNMCRYFGRERVIPVYIEVRNITRVRRAFYREMEQTQPDYQEMRRRFRADRKDFSEEILRREGITRRFQNEELEKCLHEIKLFIQK